MPNPPEHLSEMFGRAPESALKRRKSLAFPSPPKDEPDAKFQEWLSSRQQTGQVFDPNGFVHSGA